MSDTVDEAERRILATALSIYKAGSERAAMRGAIMDACGLLDAIATNVQNDGRRRGYIKKRAREDALMLTRAADRLMKMRDKINVPREKTV